MVWYCTSSCCRIRTPSYSNLLRCMGNKLLLHHPKHKPKTQACKPIADPAKPTNLKGKRGLYSNQCYFFRYIHQRPFPELSYSCPQ